MARPRKKKYQGLPPYLHFDQVNQVYRYRHPQTGKYHYLGKDKPKAVSATLQLNSILMQGQDLVAKVIGTSQTLTHYISTHFETKVLTERDLAAATLEDYSRKLKSIKSKIGDLRIDEISVKDISTFLAEFPPTQANRYRSLLSLVFKYAVSEGLCSDNPAESTLNRRITKQRQRLTLEAYQAIYKEAEPWLRNAMDLALLTLQRREDISNMQFRDIKEGYLFVIQKKTEKHGQSAYIKIKIGTTLQQLIERCKDRIRSPYLVHRLPHKYIEQKSPSTSFQVTPDYITKAFSTARDATGLFDNLAAGQKPTFHEIRSLGIKLYEDSGVDAQALAGHASRVMTEHYKSGHEIQWTEAEAFMCLSWIKI